MAELAIRSVRKTAHADWLPSRAISLLYRPTSFGGKISDLIWRITNQIQVPFLRKIYKSKLRKKKLNVLKNNFKQRTKEIDAKNHDVTGKNKQVKLSR